MFPPDIEALAAEVVAEAAARGRRITAAESCTGGLVAAALTQVPGASAVLDQSFVTYSNAAKADALGVPDGTLARWGAVSRETAEAMAAGALRRAGADVAIAITGIAGPGGGSPDKPVGLVHFAAASHDGGVWREARFGDLGRTEVRLAAVRQALTMLRDRLGA